MPILLWLITSLTHSSWNESILYFLLIRPPCGHSKARSAAPQSHYSYSLFYINNCFGRQAFNLTYLYRSNEYFDSTCAQVLTHGTTLFDPSKRLRPPYLTHQRGWYHTLWPSKRLRQPSVTHQKGWDHSIWPIKEVETTLFDPSKRLKRKGSWGLSVNRYNIFNWGMKLFIYLI